MDETARKVRKFVLDSFLERTDAPAAEEIANGLSLTLPATKGALKELDAGHHLRLLEGTYRILMAFPFSAISTPFRVTRSNGKRYFANCAWDSIAFLPMLDESIRIDSFCDRCARPLGFRLESGGSFRDNEGLPFVHLKLPASAWWRDITRTCSNTMVFVGPEEMGGGRDDIRRRTDTGYLTVEQVVQISIPIYSGKLKFEYDRPPASTIQMTFERLGLSGPHWKL